MINYIDELIGNSKFKETNFTVGIHKFPCKLPVWKLALDSLESSAKADGYTTNKTTRGAYEELNISWK